MREDAFDQELPCDLSPAEFTFKSKSLAEQLFKLGQLELEKKLANEDFKSREKVLEEHAQQLAREVRTGKEYRQIQCVERPDYGDGMVDLLRMDTGEVWSRRPMQPEERQKKLDLELEERRLDSKARERARDKARGGKKQPDNDNAVATADADDDFKKGMQ